MASQTVYLDSALWFNLAEDQTSREVFETSISSGSLIPVLSFIHLTEFSRRRQFERLQVANYVDRINAICPILWSKGLATITEAEVKNAFLASLGIEPAPIVVFANNFIDAMTKPVGWADKVDITTQRVSTIVERLRRTPSTPKYLEYRKSVPVFDIPGLRNLRQSKGKVYIDLPLCVRDTLGKAVTTPKGLKFDVTKGLLDRFLSKFKPNTCPAFSLALAFLDGWSKSDGGEMPSIFEDFFHLMALAYCDIMFADGQTCEALKKGRAFKKPMPNAKFPGWANSLV